MRDPIPHWKGWMKSRPNDDGRGPPEYVKKRVAEIRAELHTRKVAYTRWIRSGVLADKPIATYTFGPIEMPVDAFTSSRWHERRTNVPLPLDVEGWHFCWEFWRGADSYIGIRDHIEEFGMRRPVLAEFFVNYDPIKNNLVHRAFSFRGENPRWPLFVLRTGNERLMMALFEWGWDTIPTLVVVRDCGHNEIVTAMLRYIADRGKGTEWVRSRGICRYTDQKGGFYGYEHEADGDESEALGRRGANASNDSQKFETADRAVPGSQKASAVKKRRRTARARGKRVRAK